MFSTTLFYSTYQSNKLYRTRFDTSGANKEKYTGFLTLSLLIKCPLFKLEREKVMPNETKIRKTTSFGWRKRLNLTSEQLFKTCVKYSLKELPHNKDHKVVVFAVYSQFFDFLELKRTIPHGGNPHGISMGNVFNSANSLVKISLFIIKVPEPFLKKTTL